MEKKQSGFTIIELMIVILIVGVLAAIAVPLYNDYTVRTKISEGLTFASVAKSAVSEYRMSNASMPTTNAQVGLPATINSPFVANVQVGTNGIITISFTASSGVPTGNVVQFVPTVVAGGGITWVCNGAGTTVPDHLLPKECR